MQRHRQEGHPDKRKEIECSIVDGLKAVKIYKSTNRWWTATWSAKEWLMAKYLLPNNYLKAVCFQTERGVWQHDRDGYHAHALNGGIIVWNMVHAGTAISTAHLEQVFASLARPSIQLFLDWLDILWLQYVLLHQSLAPILQGLGRHCEYSAICGHMHSDNQKASHPPAPYLTAEQKGL